MNRRILLIVVLLAAAAGAALYFAAPGAPVPDEPDAAETARVEPSAPPPREPEPAEPAGSRAPAPTPAPRAPAARSAPAPVESAPPDVATLRIDSDVPGAQVFIDRKFIGQTPVTAPRITPGTHRLNVSAEGFEGIAQTIEVEPGERDITVKLREVRLEAAVDVVHKHGIGSCNGRLTATPHGMRYETAHREHGFSVALTALDTFEVEYLEKNLSIRFDGNTYNFTHPEGDADRLFVFHRDVAQARDRLAKGDPPASGGN